MILQEQGDFTQLILQPQSLKLSGFLSINCDILVIIIGYGITFFFTKKWIQFLNRGICNYCSFIDFTEPLTTFLKVVFFYDS